MKSKKPLTIPPLHIWGPPGIGKSHYANDLAAALEAPLLPVFLIDELDKAPPRSGYDPLSPLHSLLEPLTAATIRDAALDITFDASLATYVAASNDPRKIPESLRSRFSEFEVPLPHGEHALQIAQMVAKRTIEKLSVPDFRPPEPRLTSLLAHLTPRAIGKAVQRAVARAIVNDRRYLKASDLPSEALDDDRSKVVLH